MLRFPPNAPITFIYGGRLDGNEDQNELDLVNQLYQLELEEYKDELKLLENEHELPLNEIQTPELQIIQPQNDMQIHQSQDNASELQQLQELQEMEHVALKSSSDDSQFDPELNPFTVLQDDASDAPSISTISSDSIELQFTPNYHEYFKSLLIPPIYHQSYYQLNIPSHLMIKYQVLFNESHELAYKQQFNDLFDIDDYMAHYPDILSISLMELDLLSDYIPKSLIIDKIRHEFTNLKSAKIHHLQDAIEYCEFIYDINPLYIDKCINYVIPSDFQIDCWIWLDAQTFENETSQEFIEESVDLKPKKSKKTKKLINTDIDYYDQSAIIALIESFIESDAIEMNLPPISKQLRANFHKTCQSYLIKTKSQGKGTRRFLRCFKTNKTVTEIIRGMTMEENIGHSLLCKLGWNPDSHALGESIEIKKRFNKRGL
eukprot:NODE_311_length_10039_cov_0.864487.p2 type:complete len:432 gc:universal NODE_311_length_10039_cov_0.864487:4122-5417(+)